MEIDLVKLVKFNLTADEYIWLHQRYYDTAIPVNYVLDKDKLQANGWVKVLPDQIVIRNKTKNMFEGGEYVYDEDQDSVNTDTITYQLSKVKEWASIYREQFPVKNSVNRMLRATLPACSKKLEIFIKNYSTKNKVITKDMVLEATKKYLKEQARERYTYTKAANYFIEKDGDSLLLQYIESAGEMDTISDGSKSMSDDI